MNTFGSSADQDGDKKLKLSEFISLPVGTVDNQRGQDIDDEWVRERKKEFQEVIDANRDGIVTMEELEVSAAPGPAGSRKPLPEVFYPNPRLSRRSTWTP